MIIVKHHIKVHPDVMLCLSLYPRPCPSFYLACNMQYIKYANIIWIIDLIMLLYATLMQS